MVHLWPRSTLARPYTREFSVNFPNLPTPLQSALAEHGYDAPTDVQAAVLEPEAHDRDLLVSAQTGSGKTVAFGLAIARNVLDLDGKAPSPGAPLALVALTLAFVLVMRPLYESATSIRIDEQRIEAVNATENRSAIGHALAGSARFDRQWGCVYRLNLDRVSATLYSIGDVDVSGIAASYGGGGHRNAAGFSVSLKTWVADFL